jgi:hypothetical protein
MVAHPLRLKGVGSMTVDNEELALLVTESIVEYFTMTDHEILAFEEGHFLTANKEGMHFFQCLGWDKTPDRTRMEQTLCSILEKTVGLPTQPIRFETIYVAIVGDEHALIKHCRFVEEGKDDDD